MKIALLNIYNGIVERGSEVFVHELGSQLSEKHEVTVFQTGDKRNSSYRIVKISKVPFFPHQSDNLNFGIIGVFLRRLLYELCIFLFTLKCLPFLWENKYDWIIPINGGCQVIICRLLRSIKGGKILISGHAGRGRDDAFNILLGKPDIFVALSPKAQEWAKKLISEDRVFYIPNGVDLEKFNPKVPPAPINIKKPLVICVSALLPYKRIHLLIESLNKLKKVNLLLIGDGPEKDKLKRLGSKLLGDKFTYIAKVSHEDLPKYYRLANLFSLPSLDTEAFGLVYLEALGSGIPVVAPEDENRRAIIGDAGLYTNPEDISGYAETIDMALDTNFGEKPRIQAEKFSWEKAAQRYEKIWLGNI